MTIKTNLLIILLLVNISNLCFAQQSEIRFGTEVKFENIISNKSKKGKPIKWINVNTDPDTWKLQKDILACTGQPIGVMRSEKKYENFILNIEWKHLEAGGNSGIFVWSDAKPGSNRLPGGVEVQMLDLEWIEINTKNGVAPPLAYVHGELFGVGGVNIVPDNPR